MFSVALVNVTCYHLSVRTAGTEAFSSHRSVQTLLDVDIPGVLSKTANV